ncbi:hypothetical protein B0J15DRAFT_465517 [Fusarium solani]|uniref:Uncharacterized protein n=1 Tax=Fusarium solani TaxID=169388 RepID=A0A9P9HIV5_FUSSL|nr:uncharacterized protein B0J15DRAFT_465517 [Fusarium solani]KAH7258241.1 hypothetical protein B0J15DRAFT_465517 [Fusarium solani]
MVAAMVVKGGDGDDTPDVVYVPALGPPFHNTIFARRRHPSQVSQMGPSQEVVPRPAAGADAGVGADGGHGGSRKGHDGCYFRTQSPRGSPGMGAVLSVNQQERGTSERQATNGHISNIAGCEGEGEGVTISSSIRGGARDGLTSSVPPPYCIRLLLTLLHCGSSVDSTATAAASIVVSMEAFSLTVLSDNCRARVVMRHCFKNQHRLVSDFSLGPSTMTASVTVPSFPSSNRERSKWLSIRLSRQGSTGRGWLPRS